MDAEDLRCACPHSTLEDEFRESFLPLVIPPSRLAESDCGESAGHIWVGRKGYGLAFLPPPRLVKTGSTERPDRLGMANGRLKALRTLPLDGKIALAQRVLNRTFEVTDDVAVSFSGGRDSLVALHLILQRSRNVKVVFVNTSVEFPETVAYVRQLANDWQLELHEVTSNRNFWQLSRERGCRLVGEAMVFSFRNLPRHQGSSCPMPAATSSKSPRRASSIVRVASKHRLLGCGWMRV